MNNENDITTYLKQLNLSDKEIEIYLALLKLGKTGIVPVAKQVQLPRTTVYYLLEKLRDANLIEILEKKTRRSYLARAPRTILTLLNDQKEKIQEKIDTFKKGLPELDRLYHISPFQPGIRFFKGKDIRLIYEEMLMVNARKDSIWYVADTQKIIDAFGEEYVDRWIERRIAKKIPSRSIRIKSGEDKEINAPYRGDFREYRYAPDGFKSPAQVIIYQNNVAIITTSKESFGTVITSEEYAETMRHWFEELWKVSKN